MPQTINPGKMKNSLIILVICFATISANAQTLKGKIFTGGNIIYSNLTDNLAGEYKGYNIGLDPKVGWFINDKVVLGVSGIFSIEKRTYEQADNPVETKITSAGGGIFGRYYKNLTPNLSLFGEGAFVYSRTKSVTTTMPLIRGNDLIFSVKPGLTYHPSAHWGFDTGIELFQYEISNYEREATGEKRANYNFSVNALFTQMFLGVNYYF